MEWISACGKPHGKPRHVAKDFDSFCHALLPLLRRKKRNNQCGIARIEFRVIKSNCTVKCVNYHVALALALRFAAGAAFGAAALASLASRDFSVKIARQSFKTAWAALSWSLQQESASKPSGKLELLVPPEALMSWVAPQCNQH